MNAALVRYRIQKAEETLGDAEYLLADGRLVSAVNRLYYSMFYAVQALLQTKELSSSKHSGVRAMFNQHFVNTGAVSKEAGRLYGELFKSRQRGDYVDFTEFSEARVRGYLDECREHIAELKMKISETVGGET